jgi:transcriptional regulator with GAF, ATPase, and Fis domain
MRDCASRFKPTWGLIVTSGLLCAYDFPGNVRELENLIQRALLFTTGSLIEPGEWFSKRPAGTNTATSARLEDLEHHAVLRAVALYEGQHDAGDTRPRDQQDHLVAAHQGLSFVFWCLLAPEFLTAARCEAAEAPVWRAARTERRRRRI